MDFSLRSLVRGLRAVSKKIASGAKLSVPDGPSPDAQAVVQKTSIPSAILEGSRRLPHDVNESPPASPLPRWGQLLALTVRA
jgi:hypothetical protein